MRSDIKQLTVVAQDLIPPPKGFLEIGSRDGHDTAKIRDYYNLSSKDCWIVEAHPDCCKNIAQDYPEINLIRCCASSTNDGFVTFNAGVFGQESNVGKSSVLKRAGFISREISVKPQKIETLVATHGIDADLCKIDVEGYTLNVLEGMEGCIRQFNAIQIELEVKTPWEGGCTAEEVITFMDQLGFEAKDTIDIKGLGKQLDALFVKISK